MINDWLNKRLSFPLRRYLHVLLGTLFSQPTATTPGQEKQGKAMKQSRLDDADQWKRIILRLNKSDLRRSQSQAR